MKRVGLIVVVALLIAAEPEYYGDISDLKLNKPEDKVVVKSTPPPKQAIILFDGKSLDNWTKTDGKTEAPWKLVAGGTMEAKSGNIITKEKFDGSFKLHVEFRVPYMPKATGQGRGNSGVFLADRYEIQVLDNYKNPTYWDGACGAIYKQWPPMVNACRKPGEWQTFDIIFESPRFDDKGKLVKPGYATVLQNGVVVQNHSELKGSTAWDRAPAFEPHPARQPIHLQWHGNPVRYRNIWVREIKPQATE